jgi:hypothetical protein
MLRGRFQEWGLRKNSSKRVVVDSSEVLQEFMFLEDEEGRV